MSIILTLFEQIMMCLFENFINPHFEPIFIDKSITKIITKLAVKMNEKKSNILLLKETYKTLRKIPNNVFITSVLKSNVIRVIGIIIQILQTKKRKIHKLKTDNNYLANNCSELNNQIVELKQQTEIVVIDTWSSKRMQEATTFSYSVS
jgi:hypothetical protein